MNTTEPKAESNTVRNISGVICLKPQQFIHNHNLVLAIPRAATVTFLALAAGCSPPQAPQATSSPSIPADAPPVAKSTALPSQTPSPAVDFLGLAEDKAIAAQNLAKLAQSKEDWQLVASRWQQAIGLLQSMPNSHPQSALAKTKIAAYQRYLVDAQSQAGIPTARMPKTTPSTTKPLPNHSVQASCKFLVIGGGGAPSYNEIALEKNVLYFQRTLQTLGYNPASATVFFANGNDGQATVRYLDEFRQQQFKVPQIPYLKGASTLENFLGWLRQTAREPVKRPIFFYFTGHGGKNQQNLNNNSMILWQGQGLSVQQFSRYLDSLPTTTPVVTMMSQCYSGSFANFIYQGGSPTQPVALQTRCGFFATVSTQTSVGCTPEVNESDYKDYSSSFFAGLSGRSRTGEVVASADYNRDGRVSYAEAHAFAKVDERTTDVPISTSEAWLQRQAREQDENQFLRQPINQILQTARPEQRYAVKSIVQMFDFNPQQSLEANWRQSGQAIDNREQETYVIRLRKELLNIGMEKKIRAAGDRQKITILNRLIKCESGSWRQS